MLPLSTVRRAPMQTAALDRTRRRLAQVFMAQHALSPEDAINFSTTTAADEKIFARMVQTGIVRDAGRKRYYLDLAAYDANIERRRRIGVIAAIAFAVTLAVLTMAFYVDGSSIILQ